MVRPDYRDFISHSAKGSTWDNHKYIKRVDGTYYYPNDYKGGRHLPEGGNDSTSTEEEPPSSEDLSEDDIEKLAQEVIRGNFGNGQQRSELLGDAYEKVQKRVNELLKGSAGEKRVSEITLTALQKVEEVAKSISSDDSKKESKDINTSKTSSNAKTGIDMDTVLKIYRNKDKK